MEFFPFVKLQAHTSLLIFIANEPWDVDGFHKSAIFLKGLG